MHFFVKSTLALVWSLFNSSVAFGLAFAAASTVKSGILAGLGLFIVTPLYITLYIIVYFSSMIPAALISWFVIIVCLRCNFNTFGYIISAAVSFFVSGFAGKYACTVSFQRSLSGNESFLAFILPGLFMAVMTIIMLRVFSKHEDIARVIE